MCVCVCTYISYHIYKVHQSKNITAKALFKIADKFSINVVVQRTEHNKDKANT